MAKIKPWLRPRYLEWRKAWEKTPEFREKKRLYFAKKRKDPAYRKKWLEYHRAWKIKHWLRILCMRAEKRAKERGIACNPAYLRSLSERKTCQACGVRFNHSITKKRYRALETAATLDRIDQPRGYVEGNVGVICWRCNRIKSDATAFDLRAILRYMERSA